MLILKPRCFLLSEVARPSGRLIRQGWRSQPVRGREIEEFQHVVRRRVTRSQRGHVEPDFNQPQDGSQIAPRMRNKVRPDPRRDYSKWQEKTVLRKGARLISGLQHGKT